MKGKSLADAVRSLSAYGRRVLMSSAALSSLLLAACASGPDYQPVMPDAPAQAPFVAAVDGVFSLEEAPREWWRLYDEAALEAALAEALASNTDLRAAQANLARAEAVLRESGVERWPSTSASASSTSGEQRFMTMGTPVAFEDTIYNANLDVSWQVDLFGRIRRALEAAEADSEAALAALHAAQVTVAAETVRAWAGSCAAGFQLDVARNSVALQEQSLDLTRRLLDAGRGTALEVASAGALLEQLRAEIPSLEARREAQLYRLAVLMGRPPAEYPEEAAACTTLPQLDQPLPVGDGAGLLSRRPDLREAERRLAAATARIGLATAELYPRVSLGASLGSLALSAGDLGSSDTQSFTYGPLLSWNFPNNSLARARIAQAEAAAQGALAAFDGSWLEALRETETALAAYAHELERRERLASARDFSAQAAQLADVRFDAGQLNFLDVLRAELTLANSEMALARSQAAVLEGQIDLFLSLGGGWGE